MLEPLPTTFLPFDTAEVGAIRASAALDRSFIGLARRAMRAQFLQCAFGSLLSERDRVGLHDLEDALLLMLGARLAEDEEEARCKVAIFCGRTSGGGDAVEAMLLASLDADLRRLGPMAGQDGRGEASGPH